MSTETNQTKSLEKTPHSDKQKGIENHKTAAKHFEAASKFHIEAAKHHEDGNHAKAAESTIKAHGHSCCGNEAQKEDVKHHVEHN